MDELGVIYIGMPADCYEKILAATKPDSDDAYALMDLIGDTGLDANDIYIKLSNWKPTTLNDGTKWYYDPNCTGDDCHDYDDWQMGTELFGAEFDIECPIEGVVVISSTQLPGGF